MDFINLEIRNKTFTREGVKKGQNYILKYRKFNSKSKGIISQFYVSNSKWDELGLDDKGFIEVAQREDPSNKKSKITGVALLLVSEDKAKIFKGKGDDSNSKMKSFRNTIMEADLAEAGIIDESKIGESQYLDLVEVKDVKNMPPYVFGVYNVVASEKLEGDDSNVAASEKLEDNNEAVENNNEVVEEELPKQQATTTEVEEDSDDNITDEW